MEEEKIQNSGIGGAPVVLLVLSYVNPDLLTRSSSEHVVLLSLESPLTNYKFRARQSFHGIARPAIMPPHTATNPKTTLVATYRSPSPICPSWIVRSVSNSKLENVV